MRTAIIFTARARLAGGHEGPETDRGAASVGRVSQHVDGSFEGGVFGADRKRAQRHGSAKIVGVLAMSVDLGEFNVLEKELPPGHEVVLIDLREATIDGETRRGLVLHHQGETAYREGEPPPWVGSERCWSGSKSCLRRSIRRTLPARC